MKARHTRWDQRRRLCLPFWVALTLSLASCSTVGVPESNPRADTVASEPPLNILVLVTDDQRWDAVGYRTPIVQTPHLDALAQRALRFDNAFVTTSICPASRASIFTGTVEHVHRLTFKTPPLTAPLASGSYPALLRERGYRTGLIGKLGIELQGGGEQHFDHFVPLTRRPYFQKQSDGTRPHVTELVTRSAIDFLRDASTRKEPFALSVSFHAPHADDKDEQQYFWPSSVDHLYRDVQIPPPALGGPSAFEALPPFLQESKNRERWYWRFDTPEKYQRMVAGYYRMISGVDRAVGELLAELDHLGLAENTVIAFTSDNGYFLGERGLAGKWLGYDPALRVPLLLYHPLAARSHGTRSDDLVLNTDIAPTLLEIARVRPPEFTSGRSLLPLLEGDRNDWRDDFFFEHLYDDPDIPKHIGLRTRHHKYIRYFEQEPVFEEVYDLDRDPLEQNNLALSSAHRRLVKKLRRRCNARADYYAELRARLRLAQTPAAQHSPATKPGETALSAE